MKVVTKKLLKDIELIELTYLVKTTKQEEENLSLFRNRLRIISYLPEDILSQVQDINLLALGIAKDKVKQSILKYIKLKTAIAFIKYDKSIAESCEISGDLSVSNQFEKHPYINSIIDMFDESVISAFTKKLGNIYLELNCSDCIVLLNAETLVAETNPVNSYIRFFELHKCNSYYELHFLLMKKNRNLTDDFHYLTIKFNDMDFV